MKIAVLDDYLRRSQAAADWSNTARTCAITGLTNRTLDVAAATERGIVVSYIEPRGGYGTATCELENTMAFLPGSPLRLLAPERNLSEIHRNE